jgi:hypothetical protein
MNVLLSTNQTTSLGMMLTKTTQKVSRQANKILVPGGVVNKRYFMVQKVFFLK